MALVILEGIDRTGKSTVAKFFEKQGYKVIHMSAPSKKYLEPGYSGPSYLDELLDIVQEAAIEDIVLDRSQYGELIWSVAYGREPMLTDDDIQVLREVEEAVGVRRILMYDPHMETHWQRCVDNNEPLNRAQFMRARTLYDRMATKYGFEKINLKETSEFELEKPEIKLAKPHIIQSVTREPEEASAEKANLNPNDKTPEQLKLEKANAINSVLSKRVIKSKGDLFDEIEADVRNYLNHKLGTILGSEDTENLSQDEILVLKTFVQRIKAKEEK